MLVNHCFEMNMKSEANINIKFRTYTCIFTRYVFLPLGHSLGSTHRCPCSNRPCGHEHFCKQASEHETATPRFAQVFSHAEAQSEYTWFSGQTVKKLMI